MWTQLLRGPVRVLRRGDNLLQEELKSQVENPPVPSGELEPHPGVRHPALQVRRHVVMVRFSPPCVPGRALLVGEEAETQEAMDFLGEGVGRDPPPHSQEKDLS